MAVTKRKKPDHHVNQERWLVSYADYVTLLFATFTALYGISILDLSKLKMLNNSMRSAFRTVSEPAEGGKTKLPEVNSDGDLMLLAAQMEELIIQEDLYEKVKLHVEPRGVVLAISDTAFFLAGSEKITPGAMPLVNRIGTILSRSTNPIRIEGHADNTPVVGNRFRSNWDLSGARAGSFVNILIRGHGIDPKQLSVAGYGAHRPVAENTTLEGRQSNRRVEVVILRDAWSEPPPTDIDNHEEDLEEKGDASSDTKNAHGQTEESESKSAEKTNEGGH